MTPYRLLFTPIRLGPVEVPNRVVFSAHLTNLAEENRPGSRLRNYYLERARGGCGLIITEEQSVHPSDFAYEKLIHAYEEGVIPHYRRLTAALHGEGVPVFCQINHNGLQGFSFFNDEPLWGPSPVGDGLFREVPQSIGESQIAALAAGYRRVAVHAREGGFDGLELQASHSSILRQFMSPHTNQRSDRWGGSVENRLRLTVECLRAVRQGAGNNLAVGIRLCTDELIDGGLVLDEVVEMAARLDAEGLVDFINTSIGTTARLYMVEGPMSVPAGYQSGHTAAIREAVKVPVIGVGRINDPLMADRLLTGGVCDLVGVVRANIADPDWAAKSRDGQASEIRKCIACNQYCIGLMGLNAPLSCIQNPANGYEAQWGGASFAEGAATGTVTGATTGTLTAGRPKRVWVIGAGPAGMEAAIVAAQYGHRVTLFDREPRLGGNINWIVKVSQRLEFGDLIRNKTAELKRHGAALRLGREVTANTVLEAPPEEAPDAVILATGQEETRPGHIPGMDGPRVRTPIQVLEGPRPASGHALIIDEMGDHQAASLTEYLAGGGCRVTLVTSAFHVGQHLGASLDLELWHGRLGALPDDPVTFVSGHIVMDVSGDPLLLNIQDNTQRNLEGVDLIVPVNAGRPRDGMAAALEGHMAELYRVGDCLAPKDVGEAILDGHRAARRVAGLAVAWE
ncbi:MAG: FAD-dependent oxidoreductase [SAR324 cluster bacterium]|nr:FAD-dependent oxidoreductase [SAR324 cluster bacterium]